MLINKKGFTLIEMLIVVAIIGILAAVVLIGLGPTQRSGRDARRLADLKEVQTALELYFQKNGVYPNASDWSTLSNTLVSASIGVNNVPDDPRSGAHYIYSPNSSKNSYLLGATLEDANNPALQTSVHGTQPNYGSLNCDSPVYCLIF